MSMTYNGTAWGSGDVNASGAFSVSGLGGMPAGSYTIAATYAGDAKFNGSSGSVEYYIDQFSPYYHMGQPGSDHLRHTPERNAVGRHSQCSWHVCLHPGGRHGARC